MPTPWCRRSALSRLHSLGATLRQSLLTITDHCLSHIARLPPIAGATTPRSLPRLLVSSRGMLLVRCRRRHAPGMHTPASSYHFSRHHVTPFSLLFYAISGIFRSRHVSLLLLYRWPYCHCHFSRHTPLLTDVFVAFGYHASSFRRLIYTSLRYHACRRWLVYAAIIICRHFSRDTSDICHITILSTRRHCRRHWYHISHVFIRFSYAISCFHMPRRPLRRCVIVIFAAFTYAASHLLMSLFSLFFRFIIIRWLLVKIAYAIYYMSLFSMFIFWRCLRAMLLRRHYCFTPWYFRLLLADILSAYLSYWCHACRDAIFRHHFH